MEEENSGIVLYAFYEYYVLLVKCHFQIFHYENDLDSLAILSLIETKYLFKIKKEIM